MTVILVGGTIAAERGANDEAAGQLKQLGMHIQKLEQRATAVVLESLGLSAADARTISKRQRPVMHWPAAFVEASY
jgi:hypothetical protein